MTIGNEKIVKCPYCGATKELMSLNSSNNIGAQYWSDLKTLAPMDPKISPVQKCAECGKYYLEYKQETDRGEKESFERGKLTYWEWKEAYKQFCTESAGITKDDLLNIRGWFVQAYNDYYYRGSEEINPPKEEHDLIVEVIHSLIETIDWSETIDPLFPGGVFFGDPAQEKLIWSSTKSPILKAELYREAGEFDKCGEILQSLVGKEANEFDAYLCGCIKEWMDKSDVKVFKFYDENEERQSEHTNNKEGWKRCPDGHYYKGEGTCPFCENVPQKKVVGWLEFNKFGQSGVKYDIFEGHNTIGSGQDCSIVVHVPFEESGISSNHAKLLFRAGKLSIIDNMSSWGTFVNGEDIEFDPCYIKDGDIITLGKTEFVFHSDILLGNVSSTFQEELPRRQRQNEYRRCPQGHYYQGDHCPYCPDSKAPGKQSSEYELKSCHNLHAYNAELGKCPICGSSIVVDKFKHRITDTTLWTYIRLKHPVQVKVGERLLRECGFIRVALPWWYKYGYFFSVNDDLMNREEIEIEPDKEIMFGLATMTGREFIGLCDLILENKLSVRDVATVDVSSSDLIQMYESIKRVTGGQLDAQHTNSLKYGHNVFNSTIGDDGVSVFNVKVCPNGHGYDVNHSACPFCGDKVVTEIIKERAGFTLATIDLLYESKGVPVFCQFAEVDGCQLTGNLCMCIEYTGSFKYAYYVSQKGVSGGLIVNPQSHVVLTGDGFSDTYTGIEFYKICDLLFDKHKHL